MSKHLVTVGMDDTLHTIRRIFQNQRFHHLMVVEHGKLMGVISDRDYLKLISPSIEKNLGSSAEMAVLKRRAHQIMTRTPVTIHRQASLEEAVGMFLDEKVSCLPVVDDEGHLKGVLSWRDILRIVRAQFKRAAAAASPES
jgi:acetoin utilization protein AcuB